MRAADTVDPAPVRPERCYQLSDDITRLRRVPVQFELIATIGPAGVHDDKYVPASLGQRNPSRIDRRTHGARWADAPRRARFLDNMAETRLGFVPRVPATLHSMVSLAYLKSLLIPINLLTGHFFRKNVLSPIPSDCRRSDRSMSFSAGRSFRSRPPRNWRRLDCKTHRLTIPPCSPTPVRIQRSSAAL